MRLRAAVLGMATLVFGITQAGPALATHQQSTATLDRHEIVAGAKGSEFVLTVSHPSAGLTEGILTPPPPIRDVSVTLPSGLLRVVSAQSAGWSALRLSDTHILFTGGSINPGQSQPFRFTVDAATPSDDLCDDWRVAVSADGGVTNGSASGQLGTCLRVLEISSLEIVAPSGARDASVTEGQDNTCVRMGIRAAGSTELSVAPKVTLSGGTVGAIRLAAETPCSGTATGIVKVAPGATEAVDVMVAFGSSGARTLTGTAKAGASTALPLSRLVQVQPTASYSYESGSLTPEVVRTGDEVSFRLGLRQTTSQAPAVDVLPKTSFGFEGFSTELGQTLVQAGTGTITLPFPAGTVPNDEGFLPASVHLSAIDANGKPFTADVAAGEVGIGWVITASAMLSGPAPSCCVPPEERAVKNGDPLSWSGVLRRANPDTGALEPCSDCRVLDFTLVQHSDVACGSRLDADITILAWPPGGYAGSYTASARSIYLLVRVEDAAGRQGSGRSNCLEVDNVAPRVADAFTERDPWSGRSNILHVVFNGCVAGGGPLDWGTALSTTPDYQSGCTRGVRLAFVQDFPEDSTTPMTMTYRATTPSHRYRDRVGLLMPDHAFPVRDGIPPAPPTIQSVSTGEPARAFGIQSGEFVTNLVQPDVTLVGVQPNYAVELWAETGGAEGLQRSGGAADQRIGSQVANGDVVKVPADLGGFPTDGTTVVVYALAFDTAANPSAPAAASFLLDRAAPAFRSAIKSGDEVTVRFSELVPRGRNFAEDWQLVGSEGGYEVVCSPSSVQAGVTSDVRILSFDGCPITKAVSVGYVFVGPASQRYEDRATNAFADASIAVS